MTHTADRARPRVLASHLVLALVVPLLAIVVAPQASAAPRQDGLDPAPAPVEPPGDRPIEAVGGGLIVSNVPDVLPFGVSGTTTDPERFRFDLPLPPTTNLRLDVFALEQVGDRMFVGGMFNFVRSGPSDVDPGVRQDFLAAFDVNTGDFIADCRPSLDAPVYALAEIGGRLVVGGEFTSVDGVSGTSALAAIDPTSCELADGWVGAVDRRWSNQRAVVRVLETSGDALYVGGNFSHHTPLDGGAATRVLKLMRVDGNGRIDPDWRPEVMDRGVWSLAVDEARNRVFIGGFFTSVAGEADTAWVAVVDDATGAVAGRVPYPLTHPSSGHVQGMDVNGDHFFFNGSQHYIFQHDPETLERVSGTTRTWGGDGQAVLIDEEAGVVYDACHCYQTQWHPSELWPTASEGAVAHDVNWVAAHTLDSPFEVVEDFQPEVFMTRGDGPWALEMDSNNCLWVGGDVGQVGKVVPHWAGGFARLCRTPEPPATPEAPTAALYGDEVLLTWPPVALDGVSYEIWRDGVQVGVALGERYVDRETAVGSEHTYRVRAKVRGAASATSEPVTIAVPDTATSTEIVVSGAEWRYLDDGVDPGVDWASMTFDDAAWSSGPGPFGFGDGDEVTVTAPGHMTTWFRTAVDVPDPGRFTALDLYLQADDGAVVYVNGTEVARQGMPSGPIGPDTSAECCVWGADEASYSHLRVPAQLLVAGRNVIAAEVHNHGAGNTDLSFDLTAVGVTGGSDVESPGTPVLSVDLASLDEVRLSWTEPIDDTGVVGYRLIRNGEIVAVVPATSKSWVDEDVPAEGGTLAYSLVAIDGFSNASSPSQATVDLTLPDDGGPAERRADVPLLDMGSSWRVAPAGAWANGWTAPGFDDSGWEPLAAELGFGDGGEPGQLPPGERAYRARTSFVLDGAVPASLGLSLIVDDGAAVHVNGVEVARHNLSDGPISEATTASSWVGGAEENTPIEFLVPGDVLVEGDNTVAVSVHNVWRSNADLSFDLQILALDNQAPKPAAPPVELVPAGAQWWTRPADGPGASDLLDGEAEPSELDGAGWSSGPAPLGYGEAGLGTELPEGDPRFVTHYFRHEFTAAADLDHVTLRVRRDDGVVVRLNGVEVVRDNMPVGAIGPDTLAADYAFGAGEKEYHEFSVPAAGLVVGTNLVSVEVHSADRGSKDLVFDLEMIGHPG